MAEGWAAAAAFAVAGALLGFALGRRGRVLALLAVLGVLTGAAGALWVAAGRAEGLRSLAYAAAGWSAALPALLGAAIGGPVGWWRRHGRHGA